MRTDPVDGDFIAAQFLHKESRALDPQLHTHCVVFNVTFDPVEQRFKALEARPFYDQARQLTAVYRQHLGRSLRGLGYQTYLDRQGCVQIWGVDAALMARFSKRAAQRDALAAVQEQTLGRSLSNGELSRVIHQHRSKKQRHVDPETIRKLQVEQLSPEERLRLQELKEQALTGLGRAEAGPRHAIFAPVKAPTVDWVASRLAWDVSQRRRRGSRRGSGPRSRKSRSAESSQGSLCGASQVLPCFAA